MLLATLRAALEGDDVAVKAVCDQLREAGADDAADRLAAMFEAENEIDVRLEDAARLTALAEARGWDSQGLRELFGIDHDRTNNGGVAELIEIALLDGDDPVWIEEVLG